MAKQSYLEEERRRNNNPNFLNYIKKEELVRQVKRIVKDIKNNLISDQDLVCFRNKNLLDACISESFSQKSNAETMRNALLYYYNVGLNGPVPPYPCIDIYTERANVANNSNLYNGKAIAWTEVWIMFKEIESNPNADIRLIFNNHMSRINNNLFYNL